MKAVMTRAEKLSNGALKGFHKAHADLKKANDLIEQERAERAAEAEEWKRRVAEHIAAQEEAQKIADEAHARNERRIAKIADFLEI